MVLHASPKNLSGFIETDANIRRGDIQYRIILRGGGKSNVIDEFDSMESAILIHHLFGDECYELTRGI